MRLLIFVCVVAKLAFCEKVIFPRLDNFLDHAEEKTCKFEHETYKEHLENLTLWAHEMWEASAKYPTGHLRGNIFQMGDWEECITVDGPFATRYCLASIRADVPPPDPPRDPLSLYYSPYDVVLDKLYKNEEISLTSRHSFEMGLCVPESCSLLELENSLNKHLATVNYSLQNENVSFAAKINEKLCQTYAERRYFDSWDVGFCTVTITIIILTILSTLFDCCLQDEEVSNKKPLPATSARKICLAFSVRRNFADLSKKDESNASLGILYGIKVFSIMMIIMDHRFGTFLSGPLINTDRVERGYRSKAAAVIFHGDLFVDSFFVLSGLLVAYGLLVQFDKKIMNPLFIVLMRYIRLTPVYAFVVLYWASMLNHLGNGPLWKLVVTPEVEDCRKNWWLNLIYLNNYINDDHMCMIHAWYLPCDFHYFIIGIAIILLVKRHRRAGLALLTLLFVLSAAIPFVLTVVYMRPGLLQFYPSALSAPKTHPDFQLTYTKSHTRAVAYFVGMFGGYIYYRLKDSSWHLSKVGSHALQLCSVVAVAASIGTGGIFYDRYRAYDAVECGLYAALHKVGWCAGTVGLLLCASHGHATFLKSVLSWSPWIPLGKLVYGAYLIHMSFQFRSVAMTVTPKYFTYFDVISLAVSDIVSAFTAALLMYVGIEAPVRKIFKELLTPSRTNKISENQRDTSRL